MITLYTNGKIHTMDSALALAEAVVVENNKFTYVGTEEGARSFLEKNGCGFNEIDLGGNLVLPGFNDSHMHFIHYAESLRSVNLSGTSSINELKDRLKKALENRQPGDNTWLEGNGWNHDFFLDEKRFPNRFDLDEVSAEVPIIVIRACCHIGALNSAAMKELGLNKETAKQYGDLVSLLSDGEPDGVIKENYLNDLKVRLSHLDLEELKEIILIAQENLLSQGITSVQSDDLGYVTNSDYELLFRAFLELEASGQLKMRLGEQCLLEKPSLIKEFFEKGYHAGWGNDKIRVTSIKLLADGSLGARTAALREPYADDAETSGIALMSQEGLDEMVLISHAHNCPVAIHAIGDRAIELALNSIEKAKKTGAGNLRHGIVHCQITDKEMLERFQELDVLAFIQPIFIDYDMNIVDARVGNDLTQTSYAWKTMVDGSVHASIGTDCPVEAFDTMPNIYSAVARKNLTGAEKRVFLPQEKLSMEETIHAYTVEGAYASGEEDRKGTITAGKLADFIVLDRDLFTLSSEEEILKTKVIATIFDGKPAYDPEDRLTV